MPPVHSKSARFLPYSRPVRPRRGSASGLENLAAGDLPAARLSQFLKEIESYNKDSTVTYTYCNEVRRWKPWFHPRVTFKNRSFKLVSPASFRNIEYKPPQCPHSQNFHRESKDTTMKLSRAPAGGYQFQCDSHVCQFIVKIAPWDDRLIVDEDLYNKRLGKFLFCFLVFHLLSPPIEGIDRSEEDEDFSDRDSSPTRSSDEVASLLMPSSQTSTSSFHVAPACVPVITKNRPYLFDMSELEYRIHYDQEMVTIVLDDVCDNGAAYHFDHPLRPGMPLPACLIVYTDPKIMARADYYNDFFDTTTGHALRMVNSTIGTLLLPLLNISHLFRLGITSEGEAHIMSSHRRCFECHGVFSAEGYDAHRIDGICTNTPHRARITDWALPPNHHVDFKERDYPAGTTLPSPIEFSETAVGVAWSEWNSRIGVPEDVWVLLHTSIERCASCSLLRSFEANIAHRSKNNVCMDPSREVGQGGLGCIDNGAAESCGSSSHAGKMDGRVVLYNGHKY
ncbi:hypothetical protein DFH09DRAFT_1271292 [Mycena vulgaris]|nr:hypothetical protein DFH09DRAFT_1271292 [Mycena vulgaris]